MIVLFGLTLALLAIILLSMHRSPRQRTAELEQANSRLTDSLWQLQSAQTRLLFAERGER